MRREREKESAFHTEKTQKVACVARACGQGQGGREGGAEGS